MQLMRQTSSQGQHHENLNTNLKPTPSFSLDKLAVIMRMATTRRVGAGAGAEAPPSQFQCWSRGALDLDMGMATCPPGFVMHCFFVLFEIAHTHAACSQKCSSGSGCRCVVCSLVLVLVVDHNRS